MLASQQSAKRRGRALSGDLPVPSSKPSAASRKPVQTIGVKSVAATRASLPPHPAGGGSASSGGTAPPRPARSIISRASAPPLPARPIQKVADPRVPPLPPKPHATALSTAWPPTPLLHEPTSTNAATR